MTDAAHNPAVLELTRLIAEATAARDLAHAAGHDMTAAAYEIDRRILDEMRVQLAHHLSFDPADLAAQRARVQAERDEQRAAARHDRAEAQHEQLNNGAESDDAGYYWES